MWDIVRDAPFGYCVRRLSGKRYASYPEECPGFQLPSQYACYPTSKDEEKLSDSPTEPDAAQSQYAQDSLESLQQNRDTIVTWYSQDDPENPYNWSNPKKLWIGVLLFIYTFAVYVGSSLYTSGESGIVHIYGVGDVVASLGLTLYVIAYGIGPMIFSPLSEIPVVGRNVIYIVTYSIFTILCVPMALVDNFPGILVLRFLLGFFGSPCLATAGASFGDFYGPVEMPYVIAMWGGGATLAPALGPLIGGFAVQAKGWRWSSWELLWLSGATLVLIFFLMPETSADHILLKRAQRLRALTGRSDLKSESEVRQRSMNAREITFFALIKPWEINIRDPSVLFSTVYTALIYGVYYSFFESFPLVYTGIYGFNLGELGLAFLAVLVGLSVAVVCLCLYLYFVAPKHLAKYQEVPPEARIIPGLVATFLIPTGLYIFAWTSRPSIHWVVSLLGVAVSMCGCFVITQSMFIYLPFTYPRYAGSLFAANGFARSLLAGAAILFSTPMFDGIGVDGGVTLLASLSVLCIFGMYVLYFFGPSLRKRSKFAVA